MDRYIKRLGNYEYPVYTQAISTLPRVSRGIPARVFNDIDGYRISTLLAKLWRSGSTNKLKTLYPAMISL